MTSPPNGRLYVFVSAGVGLVWVCVCVFVGACEFLYCCCEDQKRKRFDSLTLKRCCSKLHRTPEWLKDNLTFIKASPACHGLKEMKWRKIIADASLRSRGNSHHPSVCFFHSSKPSSLFSASIQISKSLNLSASALKRQKCRNGVGFWVFFCLLQPFVPLPLIWFPWVLHTAVTVCACVCLWCATLRASLFKK